MKYSLRVLSLYKRQFNIQVVIFTKSRDITEFARQFGIDVLPEAKTNEYGLPFINSMLVTARTVYSVKQIVYINADIIINPGTFSVAAFFDEYFENQKVETGNQCDECVVCYGRNRHERENITEEYEHEILLVLSKAFLPAERDAARCVGDRRMNESFGLMCRTFLCFLPRFPSRKCGKWSWVGGMWTARFWCMLMLARLMSSTLPL